MPYKSEAERERERWMTLPEAVAHITARLRAANADHCDEKAARQQIRKALADGVWVLGPLSWERERDDKPPPFGYTPVIVPSDTPPIGCAWLKAKIRWNTGRVRNDWTEYKYGKWRVPLILRDKVEQHWPLAPSPNAIAKAPITAQAGRHRHKPGQEAALVELQAEYPNGIPSRAEEPDSVLVDKIASRMKSKFGEKFSPKKDSILRAAGRRKS